MSFYGVAEWIWWSLLPFSILYFFLVRYLHRRMRSNSNETNEIDYGNYFHVDVVCDKFECDYAPAGFNHVKWCQTALAALEEA